MNEVYKKIISGKFFHATLNFEFFWGVLIYKSSKILFYAFLSFFFLHLSVNFNAHLKADFSPISFYQMVLFISIWMMVFTERFVHT